MRRGVVNTRVFKERNFHPQGSVDDVGVVDVVVVLSVVQSKSSSGIQGMAGLGIGRLVPVNTEVDV